MSVTQHTRGKAMPKTIIIIRITGIVIIFLGIGLKIVEFSGFIAAFVTGAVLIIFARLSQWLLRLSRDH